MNAHITIHGNLTRDPELRFTAKGDAVANFTVAVDERTYKDGDWVKGETSYYEVTAWKKLGEQATEHLREGTAVIVTGKPKIDKYETKDGSPRTKTVITADEIGTSIRHLTLNQATPDPEAPPF